MQWLNYHHLLYFWMVARYGSVTEAASELRLAQPTVSGQIRALEESLGGKLFRRAGRNLVLTELGQTVYGYAERIFDLGGELMEVVAGRSEGVAPRFHVGVADVFPKLLAYRLLAPALSLDEPLSIVCREDKPDRLIAELALHHFDVVLSDSPIPPTVSVRAFNHPLGESVVAFFAVPTLARSLRRRFPQSLDGAPILLPTDNTSLRRSIEQWLHQNGLAPRVIGEFEDSALVKVFAQAGEGVVAAPAVLEKEMVGQYGLEVVGQADSIRERFYAITTERRLQHPAVVAMSEMARTELFH